MKVLLVTNGAVNQSVNAGNTFLNVLPDTCRIASIYTRNGLPDERVEAAFCVNEKMIFRRLLGKAEPVGRVVTERDATGTAHHAEEVNEKLIRFMQKNRFTVFFWAQDLLWRTNVWKTKEMENFIRDFNPDVIFTFFTNNIFLNRLILYVRKITQKPLVIYSWDDNYHWNVFHRSPLRWISQFFERHYMRKVFAQARKVYVVSEIQKQDYEKAFGVPCKVLTKSEDFSGEPPVKTQYNSPLQLVYTGNIGTNRWKSLAMIAEALRKLNQNRVRAQLRIYTATPLTKKMQTALDVPGTSFLMGSVPASEISAIQSDADMLVHVEAFDRKNRLAVRQSFSTKLVDYMKAARPILAVGPPDVASVEHLARNRCALIAESSGKIYQELKEALECSSKLDELVHRAYMCGKRFHDKTKMQNMILTDFNNIITDGANNQT